ncbi:acyl-CoA dehydrogenase family protein [Streptomyces sp. XD-27]|uniref:acyl-CoA dehydrogenase family protein n=1 Tax=Streptomyces sp. XD-27 TaxID=3062779 RepID=UPI0026F425A4|nr:acyl-CoA dehydrogenase family protein [Streptomyces sp. XD-27]WKX68769.1 acyl-CoA dehydrogenase family protein [Streptomyces sp. XD-27]
MDLELSPEDAAFRAEAREWLAAHVPGERLPSLETAEGFAAHRAWERTLAAGRWSVVSWPLEYGGRGASLLRRLLFEEEYYAAGAPGRVSQNGISLLAPTLLRHGTAEQRARVLPPMASGDVVWAQAWSEPEAGSDLAALRSTARRDTGGWLLSGQKTWSSRAAFADRAFGLFRSHPGADRPHQGLTYAMFPLDAPGVTVRPLGRLDGRPGFAELFLDEVFVPDEDVIGEPGEGWRVAMSTAGDERGLTLRSPGRFTAAAHRLADLWRERAAADPGGGDPCGGDPCGAGGGLRDRVADALIRARAYQLFAYTRATGPAGARPAGGGSTGARPAGGGSTAGGSTGAEASLTKVFWSELDLALHETALDLLGPYGELSDTAPDAPAGGGWADGYTFALAGPIYAGTNEIQRDIIAERLLGLPKGRRG